MLNKAIKAISPKTASRNLIPKTVSAPLTQAGKVSEITAKVSRRMMKIEYPLTHQWRRSRRCRSRLKSSLLAWVGRGRASGWTGRSICSEDILLGVEQVLPRVGVEPTGVKESCWDTGNVVTCTNDPATPDERIATPCFNLFRCDKLRG